MSGILSGLVDRDRNRIGWWLYLIALGVGVTYLGWAFVGTFTFGIFLYYASRPIYDYVSDYVDDDGLAAGVTLAGIVTPLLLVVVYVAIAALRDLALLQGGSSQFANTLSSLLDGQLSQGQRNLLNSLLKQPLGLRSIQTGRIRDLLTSALSMLGTIITALVHVALAFTMAYFLLRDDDRIAEWFREEIAQRGTTGYAYSVAVDDELETVFFGNVLFVFAMAVIATGVYYGFNFVAPPALTIPFAILLALLTGVASLVPILVGKVVYVPIVAYLAWVATGQGGAALVYPIGLLVVSFLLLDILPQTFLQPYITGQQIHFGIMMFAYLLGPLLFGWYGIFLLPLFVVLVVQAVRIVVTDLIHGDRLTPSVDAAPSLGPRPPGTVTEDDDADSSS